MRNNSRQKYANENYSNSNAYCTQFAVEKKINSSNNLSNLVD